MKKHPILITFVLMALTIIVLLMQNIFTAEAAYPAGYPYSLLMERIEVRGEPACVTGASISEQSTVRCDRLKEAPWVKNESGLGRSVKVGIAPKAPNAKFRLHGTRKMKQGQANGLSRNEIHNSPYQK